MAGIDFNSDAMIKALNQELNSRYGKGEIYKNYDHLSFHGETYTHVTEDRIKRTIELDKFALKHGKGDPIRLLSEDHSHRVHHDMKSSTYPYTTNPSNPAMSPASIRAERDAMEARHVNIHGLEPIGDWELPKSTKPKKKKSKLIGNIRERLQKETDNWLKSVQKEED